MDAIKSNEGTRRRKGSGRVEVTKESVTGANECFLDRDTGRAMTKAEFVKEIEAGSYPGYHVRKVGGGKVPASNPDRKATNNLG